jgi:hypothetical protein
MVYTHVVDRGPMGVISPLDRIASAPAGGPPDPGSGAPIKSPRARDSRRRPAALRCGPRDDGPSRAAPGPTGKPAMPRDHTTGDGRPATTGAGGVRFRPSQWPIQRLAELVEGRSTVVQNSFSPTKMHQFRIVDGTHKVVGHVRLKPSGVLWAPKNAKVWYGVSLRTFAEFMEANGKRQGK